MLSHVSIICSTGVIELIGGVNQSMLIYSAIRDEEINGLQNNQIISQIQDYELSKLLSGIVPRSCDLLLLV